MGPNHSRVLALAIVLCLAPRPAAAQCDDGEIVSTDCGFIPDIGCCIENVLWWCDGDHLCRRDCEAINQLLCGWDANDPGGAHYDCGTGGGSGPGETPLTCDSDGDGYHDVWDCDPDDPTVHPEGTEVCDDGVDNDCDGDIDGDDTDCPDADDDTGGDDDTGDDDIGDDDDGGGPSDDDGRPPDADVQPGFLCTCHNAPDASCSPALLALFGLAALHARRRRS